MARVLTFEQRTATPADDDAPLIVLMHGRGANRFDLVSLGEHMPAHASVIFPEAPFAGAQWGYGPGSAWYKFISRNRPEPDSFSRALDELETLLAQFSATRVVLGGFSQGGTMSIAYALAHPGAIAGVLNFSGFVADHPRVRVTPQNVAGTSFFWGHGRQDNSIPFELAVEGRALLQQAGAQLESHDYDSGHWIEPRELSDALAWLATVIPA